MDFEAEFKSDSVQRQAKAATFLASQGKAGAAFVEHALDAMARIPDSKPHDRLEEDLLGMGLISLARVVAAAGYEQSNPVHQQLWERIVSSVASPYDSIAASAIYSLGVLQRAEGIPVLREVMESPPRQQNPPKQITLRGMAFRALMSISRQAVTPWVDSSACREYLQGVENWLADMREWKASPERMDELREECAWLRSE
jgi:hypothetical protein